MKYYIGAECSTGEEFDNFDDFWASIYELAKKCDENGDEWFEVWIVND